MDREDPMAEPEPFDVKRTLFLGVCTTLLAVAFAMLLVGDQVSAAAF